MKKGFFDITIRMNQTEFGCARTNISEAYKAAGEVLMFCGVLNINRELDKLMEALVEIARGERQSYSFEELSVRYVELPEMEKGAETDVEIEAESSSG